MELLYVTTLTVASLVIVFLGFATTEQAVMVRNILNDDALIPSSSSFDLHC